MSKLGEKIHTIIPPDRQAFDEIRITTVPRYKTSGMSGDEWRISALIQFLYKGEVVHEETSGNINYAVQMLQSHYVRQTEPIPYNPSEFWDKYCNQEGCKNEWVYMYKVKFRYCNEGHKTEHKPDSMWGTEVSRFCEEHNRRGDCGLQDADSNYELIENRNSN
jgi:hypothetical protein